MELLLLIIGSGLTLLGGYLANRQQFKLSRAAEIAQYRREKLEQLASLAISLEDWINEIESSAFAMPPQRTKGDPIEQMYMITSLYFPSYWPAVHELCDASRKACCRIMEEAQHRLQHREPSEQYKAEYLSLFKMIMEKRGALIDELGKLAKEICG